MSLQTYNQKRNFKETPEPTGKSKSPKHKLPIFVVQEHHASTHHFDFRLEADGVLKSWAVPKGPSLSPADKRLAVQVEDHPLSYATFIGDIPEGSYGAGHVDIFDHGTYTPTPPATPQSVTQDLQKGRLTFTLQGTKLKGSFTLVRTPRPSRQPQWLLIKRTDEYAKEQPTPDPRIAAPRAERSSPTPKKSPRPSRHSEQSEESKPLKSKKAPRAKSPPPTSPSPHRPISSPLSHPDKLLYPDVPLTKQDVADYYRRISHVLLPYLKNRPISLERFPAGVAEKSPRFWQKNLPPSAPNWIPRIELPAEDGHPVTYPLVNDLDALLYFVNQNALTFHIYLSTTADLTRPDLLLFDLDPGPSPFKNVVQVARTLHNILDAHSTPNYLKTSGKSGLHIVTPPPPNTRDYDSARSWAESIAQEVLKEHPTLTTTERSIPKRKGKIYIDYIQNALGHHLIAPYSLRPTSTATASTPLDWNELTARLNPQKFTAKSLPKRLATKDDPMSPLLS